MKFNVERKRIESLKRFNLSYIDLLLIFLGIVLIFLLIIGLFNIGKSPYTSFESSQKPSIAHPFGTNYFGYDYFILFAHGWKTSFLAAVTATVFYLIFGMILGVIIGYYKNVFSSFFSYVFNIINAFPIILLLLLLVIILHAFLKPIYSDWAETVRNSAIYLYLAIYGILSSPKLAEIIKSQIDYLRNQEFIKAAQCLGISDVVIITKHILWYESRKIIIAQLAYMLAEGIMIEVTLSFLNYGGEGPSWGKLLFDLNINYSNVNIAYYIILLLIGSTAFYFYYIAEKINRLYTLKRVYI